MPDVQVSGTVPRDPRKMVPMGIRRHSLVGRRCSHGGGGRSRTSKALLHLAGGSADIRGRLIAEPARGDLRAQTVVVLTLPR